MTVFIIIVVVVVVVVVYIIIIEDACGVLTAGPGLLAISDHRVVVRKCYPR